MSSLRELLKGVPQSPKHHPEGCVWTHVHLVRKALPIAETMFDEERSKGTPFDAYGPLTDRERDLLRAATWLHDVGKASATAWTHPDGSKTQWWELGDKLPEDGGRLQAIDHEEPEHYEPMLRKLGPPWQRMHEKTLPEDREVLRFLIEKHMGYLGDKVGRSFVHLIMDDRGVLRPERKVKLLIVFKLMDVIGRGTMRESEGRTYLEQIRKVSAQRQRHWAMEAEKNAPIPREEFVARLKDKGLPDALVQQAVKGKYGE